MSEDKIIEYEDKMIEYNKRLVDELRFQRDTSTELAKYRGTCLNEVQKNNKKVAIFLERMVDIIKNQPPENLDEWCIEQLEIMISLLKGIELVENHIL